MVVSWFLAWNQVWLRVWCAARRVVKGAAIGVGCATVLCCRGYEGGDSHTDVTSGLSATEATTGDHGGDSINPGLLGALTGTAIFFAVDKVGPALDNAMVAGLASPHQDNNKKSFMRRLNYGYSALKLGLILAVGKAACFCMDQSKKEADRVGLACTAGVIMAPLMASLCKTAFK